MGLEGELDQTGISFGQSFLAEFRQFIGVELKSDDVTLDQASKRLEEFAEKVEGDEQVQYSGEVAEKLRLIKSLIDKGILKDLRKVATKLTKIAEGSL